MIQDGYMTATITERIGIRMRLRRDLPEPAERRKIRETAGLSQQELAAAMGVSRQAVTFWERGERTPRGQYLDRYVEALRALKDAVA